MIAVGLPSAITIEQRRHDPERQSRRQELAVAIQCVQDNVTQLARQCIGFRKLDVILDPRRQIPGCFAPVTPRGFVEEAKDLLNLIRRQDLADMNWHSSRYLL